MISSVTDVFSSSVFVFGYVTAEAPAPLSFFNFKNMITPAAPPPTRSKTIITTAATAPGANPGASTFAFAFALFRDAPELGSMGEVELKNIVACDADEVIVDVDPE